MRLWAMLIFLIIATLYLIIYNFQTIFMYSSGLEPNPLYCPCSTSMILLVILIILLVLLVRNLKKKKE
jgi:uncharacterized protein YebE (UPF0316 family)